MAGIKLISDIKLDSLGSGAIINIFTIVTGIYFGCIILTNCRYLILQIVKINGFIGVMDNDSTSPLGDFYEQRCLNQI